MTMPSSDWHLDKKVPISIVIALFLNVIFGVWYASKLDSRIAFLEVDHARTLRVIDKTDDVSKDNNNRLIRVEDKLDTIAATVKELGERVDPFPKVPEGH